MSPTSPTLRPLSPYLSVSGQVWPDQVDALRQAGITWLVNHRPDGEEPGQPTAEAIARAGAEPGRLRESAAAAGYDLGGVPL